MPKRKYYFKQEGVQKVLAIVLPCHIVNHQDLWEQPFSSEIFLQLFYCEAVYLHIDRDHLYLDIFCYDAVSLTSSEIPYHICDSGTNTL